MKETELNESLRILKEQINNPDNKNNHVERKETLNKIQNIKHEIRLLKIENRVEEFEKNQQPVEKKENCTVKTIVVEEDFTKNNIDPSRYKTLIKRLNNKYIKDSCPLKKGWLVRYKDKEGFIDRFEVYYNETTSKTSGIRAILLQKKLDGTPSQKFHRVSKMDESGFPIEELEIVREI